MQSRNFPQSLRGVHRCGTPHRRQHPSVVRAVSVRIRSRQIQSPRRCQPPHRSRFFFPKHGLAHNPPRPAPCSLLQPRRDRMNLRRNSVHCNLRFHRARRPPRQWLERSANNHNCVPLRRMPSHPLNRFWKKSRNAHSRRSSFPRSAAVIGSATALYPAVSLRHAHSPQIHFVSL